MNPGCAEHKGVVLPRAQDRYVLARLLVEIERTVDVNALTWNGLCIWPVVRLQLGRTLKVSDALEATTDSASKSDGLSHQVTSPAERVRAIRAWRQTRATSKSAAFKNLKKQWKCLRRAAPADFVVLSKIEKYNQERSGARYAPILDPVYEDLSRRGRALTVALEPLPFKCVHEPHRLDIEPQMRATADWPKLLDEALIKSLEQVNRTVKKIEPEYEFSAEGVLMRLERWQRRMPFFEEMLRILRPQALFVSSYTGWIPAIWAARRLGIPSVDIQHGGQHVVHHPTTHFTCVPREGYTFLPDYFWVWSEANRDYISPWLPAGAVRHIALVGGNRNVAQWYRERDRGQLAEAENAFLTKFSDQCSVVLVTLGTSRYAAKPPLPECLEEAIQRGSDLTWLIRLHPNQQDAGTRNEVRSTLLERGCGNFHLDEPTSVRLQTVLSVAAHHVTPYSTSGREAMAFGVSTTVCHPIGERMFADEIAQGIYAYAPSADSILTSVRKAIARGTNGPESDETVETSERAVDDLLATVASHGDRCVSVNH